MSKGAQHPRASAGILGNAQVPVLQLLCVKGLEYYIIIYCIFMANSGKFNSLPVFISYILICLCLLGFISGVFQGILFSQ